MVYANDRLCYLYNVIQRNIQLSTNEVEEASCIRALGPRLSVKELVLDVEGRPCDVALEPN